MLLRWSPKKLSLLLVSWIRNVETLLIINFIATERPPKQAFIDLGANVGDSLNAFVSGGGAQVS